MPPSKRNYKKPGQFVPSKENRAVNVSAFAKLVGVCAQQVENLIESGKLEAFDVSATQGKRRAWRIPIESVADFKKRRSSLNASTPGKP